MIEEPSMLVDKAANANKPGKEAGMPGNSKQGSGAGTPWAGKQEPGQVTATISTPLSCRWCWDPRSNVQPRGLLGTSQARGVGSSIGPQGGEGATELTAAGTEGTGQLKVWREKAWVGSVWERGVDQVSGGE